MNKNWPRWIFASTSKHFDARRQGLHMFVEGSERETRDQEQYLEFRLDGPYVHEGTKNFFTLDIEINILCAAKKNNTDFHAIHRVTGIAIACFTTAINVFRLGNAIEDDGSYLGCLIRRDGEREALITSNFGQIEQDVPLLQSTVEGHYRMQLNGAN